MTAYYNEIDPFAAQWLRNLIDAGHIAPGHVDTRSIEDVTPNDLAGYTQCHFFAGIGGWSLALRLAGWPDDRPVWTGSCPCQPFSAAGKGAGFDDERHLWPSWFHLIEQCRPAVVFGEQVAAAVGHHWLDGVCADLEGQDYAVGASVLPARAVGAPHRRDRLWFVADAQRIGYAELQRGCNQRLADGSNDERTRVGLESSGADKHADTLNGRWAAADWLACRDGKWRPVEPGTFPLAYGVSGRVVVQRTDEQSGAEIQHWYNRAGALKGFGNAIVPQVAAEFIQAYCES